MYDVRRIDIRVTYNMCLYNAITEVSVSENYCKKLLEDDSEIPDACKRFASIKAKLDTKISDPYAGMASGAAQSVVRNAQIKRRMSTRHKPGKEGKKSFWW